MGVSIFGILVHYHDSNNLATVVAKVYLSDDGRVPYSMKVNAGLPPVDGNFTMFLNTKTVNKTLFLEANKQGHSDLGANNLVPHAYVIICL